MRAPKMDVEELSAAIQAAFPVLEMPDEVELRFHPDGCWQCEALAQELVAVRGQAIDGDVIRNMHQEMSCLSAKGWAWALPYYLPYCLTAEAEHNVMETEFLVYSLSPAEPYKPEARQRLSLLNAQQIGCLIHFVEWLRVHPTWGEYCPDEIECAIAFLRELGPDV